MTTTQLIVQGDDFGMCHAVNEGIAQSFQSGILTQASAMVPCPWISEATALAAELDLPIGTHGTLTCEWDFLVFKPDLRPLGAADDRQPGWLAARTP